MAAYDKGFYSTSDGHKIYYEQCGHPLGVPVLYLHGGPGAGLDDHYESLFDNQKLVRIIGIDQRGSGKSKPLGSLENNTINNLIDDIEGIRKLLHIDSFYIYGGSWGSTLALAYTAIHPKRVIGLNLWGIFFCNQNELEWFFQTAAPTMYADVFSILHKNIPNKTLQQFLVAYKNMINEGNQKSINWLLWESFASEHPHPNYDELYQWTASKEALACIKIENHYFLQSPRVINNKSLEEFLSEHPISCPVYITHGRNDLVTPAISALQLHELCINSQLNIIDNCGHSLQHPDFKESIINFGNELLTSTS
ncbi:alpha/beta fold hydrolase [Flammeovirga sp. SubArs3]|uniref:alpha/beta fold hydrolase n=1 Tax=Flammeovirga sp. SubArs3 TaxID=2995316 RepID=UPI00248CBBA5|nr:alpha/beta fold hydrolase [Flammeovirga sp. SubArs3]